MLPTRRVGSGRITGRDSEPPNVGVKDSRDRREPIRSTAQRERTFDRDQQRSNYPLRPDGRDKGSEKDRRNFDRTGFDRDFNRGNRYQVRSKLDPNYLLYRFLMQ